MKPMPLFDSGMALLFAAIMAGVAVGKDAPPSAEKEGASSVKKGVTNPAATPNAKPAEKADSKSGASTSEKKTANQPVTAKRSADEDAIRSTGETYVKAFAKADARAIAALFTPDAEYIDEQGDLHRGREAIEKAMQESFAANPGGQMKLNIDSIRFVSAGVAIEDGTTTWTAAGNDAEPVDSQYTAVHVKTDGKWLTASVREHAPKDRRQHRTQLQHLAWLHGDWVDEGDDSVVTFSCSAVDGGNFLLRKFTIRIAGQEAMTGTQRIGWDPLTGRLKSWVFDSEGGHSEGCWHRDQDDRWVLKSTGVTADGQPASSTTIFTLVNERTMTWQSVDHEVAGVQLPDNEPVTMVRRAPLPDPAGNAPLSKSE